MKISAAWLILVAVTCLADTVISAEPITLENVQPPAAIVPDEPRTKRFSLEQAARSLDMAALDWQKNRACTACHTMLPYLAARPALNAIAPQPSDVRQFFEDVVSGKREAMPDYT